MRACRRSQNFGDAGPPAPWDGAWLTPIKTRSSPVSTRMCGEERVGRSRSQRMGIGRGPQNFVGRWGPAPENGERV